jgi:hypothetical protein
MRVGRGACAALRAALAVAATGALARAAPARQAPQKNDLGVEMVRFAPGTTPAAMRRAVADAGG